MRVLIINHESKYFAGAQILLNNYLAELGRHPDRVTVGLVPGSRVEGVIPDGMARLHLPDATTFSVSRLFGQVREITRHHRREGVDLIHAWAARDWEVASWAGAWIKRPVIGTLHDHPEAAFISRNRRRLMRWCCRWGMDRIACISRAVRNACATAGYPPGKLTVIHNGIPLWQLGPHPAVGKTARIGFLGILSERKGVGGMLAMVDAMASQTSVPWELHLAGEPQDAEMRAYLDHLRREYQGRDWWQRVVWRGWIDDPKRFVEELDVLVCPSSQFEPFGLVVCEAGYAGVPVLASRTGGIPEIIVDGSTGRLFPNGDWAEGGRRLLELLTDPGRRLEIGRRAAIRIADEFSISKMVAEYRQLYSTLAPHV
jgi:glycosyltransferase involved in cell wall biosynthesis